MKTFIARVLRYALRRLKPRPTEREEKQLPYLYDGLQLMGPSYDFVEYYVHHLFKENRFAFTPATKTPVIYDLGTNIGLSVIYFRRRYPTARIVTLDPDRELLEKYCYPNLASNGISRGEQLEVIEKAAWTEDAILTLYTDDKDGGAVERRMTDTIAREVKVPALDFAKLLSREKQVDLLKMNIEGAEWEVIHACRHLLGRVGYLFIDYHGLVGETPRLSKLLAILEDNDFSYTLGGRYNSLQSLDEKRINNIECGVAIFAKRRGYGKKAGK